MVRHNVARSSAQQLSHIPVEKLSTLEDFQQSSMWDFVKNRTNSNSFSNSNSNSNSKSRRKPGRPKASSSSSSSSSTKQSNSNRPAGWKVGMGTYQQFRDRAASQAVLNMMLDAVENSTSSTAPLTHYQQASTLQEQKQLQEEKNEQDRLQRIIELKKIVEAPVTDQPIIIDIDISEEFSDDEVLTEARVVGGENEIGNEIANENEVWIENENETENENEVETKKTKNGRTITANNNWGFLLEEEEEKYTVLNSLPSQGLGPQPRNQQQLLQVDNDQTLQKTINQPPSNPQLHAERKGFNAFRVYGMDWVMPSAEEDWFCPGCVMKSYGERAKRAGLD